MQLAFFIDATKCTNCKTCEIACRDFNAAGDAAGGVRLRRVLAFERGEGTSVSAWNVSMSCNHCEAPACVEHCPTGAYSKRDGDGIVIHDPRRCIGCRYCVWVCPYAAPQYDPGSGRVHKCNFCVEEIDQGSSPACVASCPMRAIEIGPLELIAARPDATIEVRGLPAGLTRPACRYRIDQQAVRSV